MRYIIQINANKNLNKNLKPIKRTSDLVSIYTNNSFDSYNDDDNNINNGNMKGITEDKLNGDNEENMNNINLKQMCDYLEKNNIRYKYSITINGFIVNCSSKQLKQLTKYNENIINLVMEDVKIALHEPLPINKKINPKSNQWSLDAINVWPLWKKNIKGDNRLVAIFDTGVDKSHCQLKDNYSNIWKDFVNKDCETENEPYDDNGHGTFICGIVCGSNINDFVIGVAPKAKWMCCKILNDGGIGHLSSFIEACDYLITNKIYPDVINCSFNLTTNNNNNNKNNYKAIIEKIVNVLESYKIFVCFSIGNDAFNNIYLPEIFYTGAFDNSNKFAEFNCYITNENITKPDILAPGVNILSCISDIYLDDNIILQDNLKHKYCMLNSTSFASAYVCGSILLIIQCLERKSIQYDTDLIKDLLTQNIFTLLHDNNKSNYIIDELYYKELGKHRLNITSTIPKIINKNKYYDLNQKYINHPIKDIIKSVPKLNKSTANSLHPKYPYLNLLYIYHYFENN